ncbi:MAG: prolipoprotein diacylglyceryl transferase [Planctomycetota bacterium]
MIELAVWVHDLWPYVIRLWEGGPIRWYGMVYLLGFTLGFFLVRRATRVGISSLKPWEVMDWVTTLAIMVVIGSRVGYVLFYKPELLGFELKHSLLGHQLPFPLPWWRMFNVQEGGMSAHGGVLGLLAGTIYISRKYHHRWAHMADLCAFGGAIGLFFGRLANFLNGELYGRVVHEGDELAWTGIKFPTEMREWTADEVRRLLPGLRGLGMPQDVQNPVEWAIARIQEKNQAVTDLVAPYLTVRFPSQLFQALLEGLTVWLLIVLLWRRPRKPGLACGLWLAGYGVARFIGEFWRQPDHHLLNAEFATTHLSRGQWLCTTMIVAGALVARWAMRQDAPAMGGWLPPSDEERQAWEQTDGQSADFCGSGEPDPDAPPADAAKGEQAAPPPAS